MMLKKIAIVAGLGLALSAAAEAQTPRKGGTIRMTAPYGSSFTSMDIHTTQRAQDEIYAKGLHRSLYIWDSAEGKPVPELAKEVTVSGGGLVHTFKLRDDAYFHHGRKMTADDVIWSLQSHHGRHQGLSRRAFCPRDRGRGRGREGPSQGNLRSEENRRLHARNEADRESRSGFLLLHRADFDLSRRRGRARRASSRSRSVLGHSNLSSTCRDRASFWSGGTGSTSPASRTPTSSSCR